jgi:type II secretory pathway pseudopilin PulG
MKLRTTYYALRTQRGFTITEVIVVVGVLMVLLTVGVGYTRKGGQQIVLFREHAQLTQQILRARSLATQKLRPENELICGYGISIVSDSEYALFKDLSSGCPGNGLIGPSADEQLETFTLDKAVRILEPNHPDFVFSPRDGFVYFSSGRAEPNQDPVYITLELLSNNQRLTINVNYIGQVYTE